MPGICYLAAIAILDSLLWGSTIGYTSDSAAFCYNDCYVAESLTPSGTSCKQVSDCYLCEVLRLEGDTGVTRKPS